MFGLFAQVFDMSHTRDRYRHFKVCNPSCQHVLRKSFRTRGRMAAEEEGGRLEAVQQLVASTSERPGYIVEGASRKGGAAAARDRPTLRVGY